MANGRFALIIGVGTFSDARLRGLVSPKHDVEDLEHVLADPDIGDFDVSTCIDGTAQETRITLNRFFRRREADDFLLLYVSTHGLKDEAGDLFFAAADTSID